MKLFTRIRLVGSVGLVVATAASTGAAAPEDEETSSSTVCPSMSETAALSTETSPDSEHASHDARGPLALVTHALSKVCLSDDQRSALEPLGPPVTEQERHVADARDAFRAALADQLATGHIDDEALADEIDGLVKAREHASPTFRKALESIHEVLDGAQRAAFADAIHARLGELRDAAKGWLPRLAHDLNLTDEQTSRIHEMLEKRKAELQEEHGRTAHAFEEFKKDDFSVERITPLSEVGSRTRARAEHMVAAAKELSSILTPEQRTALAEKLGAVKREVAVDGAPVDTTQSAIVVARGGGFRAGGVRGWGGAGGYVAGGSVTVVRGGGYRAGYPLVPGYGPGVW